MFTALGYHEKASFFSLNCQTLCCCDPVLFFLGRTLLLQNLVTKNSNRSSQQRSHRTQTSQPKRHNLEERLGIDPIENELHSPGIKNIRIVTRPGSRRSMYQFNIAVFIASAIHTGSLILVNLSPRKDARLCRWLRCHWRQCYWSGVSSSVLSPPKLGFSN